ncbi:MAG: aminoglycoside phosphotransferase family protein [Clostridia bacterium]|nr:aminoglycoside phosphotransferase family protein [Clostridia bacterium]
MDLTHIYGIFGIKGRPVGCTVLKNGNINKTYKADFEDEDTQKSYIIQSINTYVFKHPEYIMENIDGVTKHIYDKLPEDKKERGVLHFLHRADGRNYYIDGDGSFWRGYEFVPNSVTFDSFDDPALFEAAGSAFGEFQLLLSDYDAKSLHEIIPGFHNTKSRYEKLFDTIEKDPAGRAASVSDEIEFLKEYRQLGESLVDMLEKGGLPLRVTHNDTKGNNILFDRDTHETLAVIDLDTVMPGLVAYDFGDAIRYGANFSDEDEPDISKTGLDLVRFEAFTKGFVGKIKDTAEENELKTLSVGAIVMTVELAVRFLDDYIDGDKYFKLNYPEHNLVRTRCQIALAKDMISKKSEMDKIIEKYI